MSKTALVLGATGGVGGETARALLAPWLEGAGPGARARRRCDRAISGSQGDALDAPRCCARLRASRRSSMRSTRPAIATGRSWCCRCSTTASPPPSRTARGWRCRARSTITIRAQRRGRAPRIRRSSRYRKGRIRVEMERAPRRPAPGVRALILRAGDFFGPRPGNSWLSQGMVTPGKPVRAIDVSRDRAASAMPGPICPMSARPSPGCSIAMPSCRLRPVSFRRHLGWRRHRLRRRDPRAALGNPGNQGAAFPLGAAAADRAVQYDDARDDRDAPYWRIRCGSTIGRWSQLLGRGAAYAAGGARSRSPRWAAVP
jgi:hypothetical protein